MVAAPAVAVPSSPMVALHLAFPLLSNVQDSASERVCTPPSAVAVISCGGTTKSVGPSIKVIAMRASDKHQIIESFFRKPT